MLEKQRPRGSSSSLSSSSSIREDLSTVKAAAWAWYERGSKIEHCKPAREFDFTTTRYLYKPSRYKVEAMRKVEEDTKISNELAKEPESFRSILSPDHADNALLDVYEISRISRELDYYIESSNAVFEHQRHRQSLDDNNRGRRRVAALPENDMDGMKEKEKSTRRSKKGSRWFWQRHGVMCGSSSGGVVENVASIRGRRPEKVVGITIIPRRPTTYA